jgi:Zn-dependent M28 family amino/carboxypeptidase
MNGDWRADVRIWGLAIGRAFGGGTAHLWAGLFLMLVALLAVAAAVLRAEQSPPAFDASRAYEHVRQMVAIGPRPAGSAALEQTRKYIKDQLASASVKVAEQAFEAQTPLGPVKMANLIATIPGARPERIAISGHYDTKLYREFRFLGANDGGSSAGFLIEMARVLAARKNPYTIEILFFDGEEARLPDWGTTDHTYGSQHYVDAAKKAGTLTGLKALILVDMIGDRNLALKREGHSTPWLTEAMWASAKKLKLQQHFLEESLDIEDDHMPFLQAGVPAVDLIDLDYSAWHTPQDTLDQVSARSLDVIGKVVLDALPAIEVRLAGGK